MNLVKSLTPKQQIFLEKIKKYIIENNYSPSFRDMAEMLGKGSSSVALSTVQYYVDTLKKKGYIDKDENNERGFTIAQALTRSLPLLGEIAAGEPIEAIESHEIIDIPASIELNPNYQYYTLKVKGDSMIDMGILNNDIVIIKHQFTANNGDVIVGIIDGGATLKIYNTSNGQIMLSPRNDKYKVIIPNNLEIRGVFQGLIRG